MEVHMYHCINGPFKPCLIVKTMPVYLENENKYLAVTSNLIVIFSYT